MQVDEAEDMADKLSEMQGKALTMKQMLLRAVLSTVKPASSCVQEIV